MTRLGESDSRHAVVLIGQLRSKQGLQESPSEIN